MDIQRILPPCLLEVEGSVCVGREGGGGEPQALNGSCFLSPGPQVAL